MARLCEWNCEICMQLNDENGIKFDSKRGGKVLSQTCKNHYFLSIQKGRNQLNYIEK